MADAAASRDALLRQAERHQRQGRTDLAIEVYDRLADLTPTDWNGVKQLADLHERAGHREAAAGRFRQCADYYFDEGFHARASALYRKVLKLDPQNEHALCQLADISLHLKLKVDARQALTQVLVLRRARGNEAGAAEIATRLAAIDGAPPPAAAVEPPQTPGETSASTLAPALDHTSPATAGPDAWTDLDLRGTGAAPVEERSDQAVAAQVGPSADAEIEVDVDVDVEPEPEPEVGGEAGSEPEVESKVGGGPLAEPWRGCDPGPISADGALLTAPSAAAAPPKDPAPTAAAPSVVPAVASASRRVSASAAGLSARLRSLAHEAEARGDSAGAQRAWQAILHIDPADRVLRRRLLAAALTAADLDTATALLSGLDAEEAVADQQAWRFRVARLAGDAAARAAVVGVLNHDDPALALAVHDALCQNDRSAADAWALLVVETLSAADDAAAVAAFVETAASRQPLPDDCLMRWVEVCVDAGLPSLDRAQLALATAYLQRGLLHEARAVADDLLLRRPDLEDVRAFALQVHEACGDELDPFAAAPAADQMPGDGTPYAVAEPPADLRSEPAASAAPVVVDERVPVDAWLAPASVRDEPAPAVAVETVPPVPPAAPVGFDWGALLGREVEPAPGRRDATEPRTASRAPEAVRAEDPGAAGGQLWDPSHEIDLTGLLDDLSAATPAPTAPAGAPLGEHPPAEPPADDRSQAPQQVAAGRVFMAAGLASEAARAFERATRDVRTRFEAASALAELHRSRGQMTEAIRWFDLAAHAPTQDAAVRRPVLYDLAETLETVGEPDRALAVLLDLLSEVEDYRDARARADRLLRVDAGG